MLLQDWVTFLSQAFFVPQVKFSRLKDTALVPGRSLVAVQGNLSMSMDFSWKQGLTQIYDHL